jgi:membrane carboxypeptidase/penicillin-binding protein
VKKIFFLLVFLLVLALAGAAGLLVLSWKLPSVASLKTFRPPVSSEVFSDEYMKIGEFSRELGSTSSCTRSPRFW